MNICQVLAGDEEGGLETHVVDLANGLSALGDTVTVIAHRKYGPRLAAAVRFVSLDLTRSRRNPWLRQGLRTRIRAAAPDIVHAHAGKAAALVASAKARSPSVCTVHNVKKDISPYLRFDAVIGVSPQVLDHVSHPCKEVVYNGVSSPPSPMSGADLRAEFDIAQGMPVTIWVGRLVPAKRLHLLLDLWDASLGHLLIVGDGPERARLVGLAQGRPVTFAGFRRDARVLMGGADLMVFASDREGFPYALAEALLARLPVVSTPVPGAVDLLPETHLGSIDELKAIIATCVASPDAARDRMRPAFDRAARLLTVEHMVRATRDVYAKVLT